MEHVFSVNSDSDVWQFEQVVKQTFCTERTVNMLDVLCNNILIYYFTVEVAVNEG